MIDTLIIGFALLQFIGETTDHQILIHLKPIPTILMILKSLWVVNCSKLITYALIFGLGGDILLMFT